MFVCFHFYDRFLSVRTANIAPTMITTTIMMIPISITYELVFDAGAGVVGAAVAVGT